MKVVYRAFVLLMCLVLFGYADAGLELKNPSLDEDYENDGFPDKWIVPEDARITMVSDKATEGKAARFDEGFLLLESEMTVENPGGMSINLVLDAAGEGGAALGIKFGFLREGKNGAEPKFIYAGSKWNEVLESDYKRVVCSFKLPGDAIGNRVVLQVYRSNQQGVIWLDNFKLFSSWGEITVEQKKEFVSLGREWRYLKARAEKAQERIPASNGECLRIAAAAADLQKQLGNEDRFLLESIGEMEQQLQAYDVAINRTLSGGKDLVSWLSDADTRLNPEEIIPAEVVVKSSVLSLGNEYQAVGVTVANCTGQPAIYPIDVKGLELVASDLVVRRQVFLPNWYDKEKERTADPLTRLPYKKGQWLLEAAPGSINKIFIGFKVNKDVAGTFPVTVQVGEETVALSLEVLGYNLPTSPKLRNYQFMYPQNKPSGPHPDLTAKDLSEHYVTDIEFPFIPDYCRFNDDGTLAPSDFKLSQQFVWMKAYSQKQIGLSIFWAGGYPHLKTVAGGVLPYLDEDHNLTPVFKTAFKSLLRAWLDFAAANGVGEEHFTILPADEVASFAEWATAPGKEVLECMELCKLTKEVSPTLPKVMTMTDYATYKDVESYLPSYDAVMPVWPYRDFQLPRNPPGRIPRTEFFEKILPLLQKEQAERGLNVWSYRVDRGTKESVLETSRAYPVVAVGLGFTGVGHWAYNCSAKMTWDDTDGGILDYSTIYDGEEKHPLNQKYNVTGEVIVPSIRWESLRLGMQDGQILLYLKDCVEKGKCDAATAAEIKAILKTAEGYGRELNYTWEGIRDISEKIRRLGLKAVTQASVR